MNVIVEYVFITLLTLNVVQLTMSACHVPSPYHLSDRKYLNVLEEHPIVKYNSTLIFGVVYNDYQILSSLANFANANVDRWRRKTVDEVIDAFRGSNYGQSFVSMCSCSVPVADGRYCCSTDECLLGCSFCNSCIGSDDYYSGFNCNDRQVMHDAMSYYSNFDSGHNTLHRTKRRLENGTSNMPLSNIPYRVGSRIKRGKRPIPTRKPLDRKCKNNVRYCSSSSEENSSAEQYDHCKTFDEKITDRLKYEGCAQWCPRIDCVCKYTRGNIGNPGYNHNGGLRYYCTDS